MRWTDRLPALLALAIPVSAGLAFMATFGAPQTYPIINSAALVLGVAAILLLPAIESARAWLPVGIACLAILAAPLVTGPEVFGTTRWLPLGPFTLHAGFLAIPLLLVAASKDERLASPLLLAALLLVWLQPDAASAFALTLGTAGLYQARPDWKPGVVALIGLFITFSAAMGGELPPQPFVERVLRDAGAINIALALGLLASLLASVLLFLTAIESLRPVRWALGGSLFGFATLAGISHYPMPLLGYGAAPILGYALALALGRRSPS